jgi:hypothetical protein
MFFKYKNLFYFFTVFVMTFFVSTISKAETSYVKINYGISNHDMGTTTTIGTITHDDEDEGFILSAGYMTGDSWGVDFMYFDLGSSSLSSLDVADAVKIEDNTYIVTTAGTISNDISGFGTGLILASSIDSLDAYIKAGVHAWDKSGSTTLLDNSTAFGGSFFDQGIGGYSGVGVAYNVYDTISVDIAYDVIGLSKDASFSSPSTLISLGLRVKF